MCLRAQGFSFQNEFSEAAGLFEEQDVSCITSCNYLITLCVGSGIGWDVTIEGVCSVMGGSVILYLNISLHSVSHLFQKLFST